MEISFEIIIDYFSMLQVYICNNLKRHLNDNKKLQYELYQSICLFISIRNKIKKIKKLLHFKEFLFILSFCIFSFSLSFYIAFLLLIIF
jgi:hypothetical protein